MCHRALILAEKTFRPSRTRLARASEEVDLDFAVNVCHFQRTRCQKVSSEMCANVLLVLILSLSPSLIQG